MRQESQPLYDVRFYSGLKIVIAPYFAYVNGGFRYLGNMSVNSGWPFRTSAINSAEHRSQESGKGAMKIKGDVEAGKVIHQVLPIYPSGARASGVQGAVVFHAIIGKDGAVHDLQLLVGQCWPAKAAQDAVSQWKYSPTLLNGKPVQVDTSLTVYFNLGKPR